jgi:hypothetical protein
MAHLYFYTVSCISSLHYKLLKYLLLGFLIDISVVLATFQEMICEIVLVIFNKAPAHLQSATPISIKIFCVKRIYNNLHELFAKLKVCW